MSRRRRRTAERTVAVVRRMPCTVRDVIDHGERVYTVDLAPSMPVPRFTPGQFLHLALDPYQADGFWPESRVFSIASSPERAGPAVDHVRGQGRLHDPDGARAGGRRQRLGQAAVRRVRGRAGPGRGAVRGRDRDHGVHRVPAVAGAGATRRGCSCSTAQGRRTCSSTATLARARASEVPALTCHLVCEATDGRLDVDAAWPAIAALAIHSST